MPLSNAFVNDKKEAGFVTLLYFFLRENNICQEVTVPSFLDFFVNTKFKKGLSAGICGYSSICASVLFWFCRW